MSSNTMMVMSRLSKKMHRLHMVPAFKFVVVLLAVMVFLAVLGHHYLSNILASDTSRNPPGIGVGDDIPNMGYDIPYGNGGRILSPKNMPFPGGRKIEDYDDGLHTDPMGGRPLSLSYRQEIEELKNIKASLINELRELENRRLRLQSLIRQYQTSVDDLKSQHASLHKDIGQAKLNLDQLRFELGELQYYVPNIRAPVQIVPNSDPVWQDSDFNQQNNIFPLTCTMESCFDFSRCSLVSGFPVYVYDPSNHTVRSGHKGGSSAYLGIKAFTAVQEFFSENVYRTNDPSEACIFLVLIGAVDESPSSNLLPSASEVEKFLFELPYWGGDGRNHVLLHLAQGTDPHYDPLSGVNTGRALMAKPTFTVTEFRKGFDIIIPPNLGPKQGENLWQDLPILSPIRRKFLFSFWGQPVPSAAGYTNSKTEHLSNVRRMLMAFEEYAEDGVKNLANRKPLSVLRATNSPPSQRQSQSSYKHLEQALISAINSYPNGGTKGQTLIDTSCEGKTILASSVISNQSSFFSGMRTDQRSGVESDWELCGDSFARLDVMLSSTFTLVLAPLNASISSTMAFQTRLLEALKGGSVPLILGRSSDVLPFSDSLKWELAALTLPLPRITEVPFFLQSFPDEDIAALRLQGREFYTKYIGSTDNILKTLLAVLRQRLNIPAHTISEESSPSAFPEDFTPLIYEGPDAEPETDEVLGPVESPSPSEMFRRNFSNSLVSDMFNKFGDPFHLYPHTPFQPVLPSESKFLGSNFGFRPLNRGAGGDGIDFSQALGGNVPREQFTIVMLTYQREVVLLQALQRFKGLPFLNKVVVVWNSELPPSPELRWPQIGVPIKVVKTKKNSLNNRFLPFSEIETEAVLSIDDDAHLRHDEIVFGFRVWREERSRIVGFPGRFHAWDINHESWNYNSNYSCELSMVLTGAAFFHKYYAYLYSYSMPQAIRDKVDEYLNCEDIAMNFLVSHITRKPPVKVTSRWTFRCPGCPTALFNNPSHFEERHKCINFFSQVYGYTPLLYTQFRVDSVLFKTRISHDKTKCFKYI